MQGKLTDQPGVKVTDWCAISWPDHGGGQPVEEAAVASAKALPSGVRRRLGAFERSIVQCILGLVAADEPAMVTLGSRYGNLGSASAILETLTTDAPPSPTQFSHSVLNAGCGVANQIRKDRTPHTAVSAGSQTLHSAMTQAWLQAAEAGSGAVQIVVLIDTPHPERYAGLSGDWDTGTCVGIRIEKSSSPDIDLPSAVALGTQGYVSLLTGLRDGKRDLFLPGHEWAIA